MNDTIPFPPTPTPDRAALDMNRIPRMYGSDAYRPADSHARWLQIRDYLPADLTGHTALEIGCAGGFLSLELARRGACVTAIDPDERLLREADALAAAHGLQEHIALYRGRVYDLARWEQGFDIVLFPELFRRVRYPMLALDIVAQRVKRVLLCDAVVIPGDAMPFAPEDLPHEERAALSSPGWPHLAFIENAFAGESSSWWVPNRAAAQAMLRAAGLGIVARPSEDTYLCQPRRDAARNDRIGHERDAATGAAPGPVRFAPETPGLPADVPLEPAADEPAA